MSYASISYTQRDRDGNTGMTESLGDHKTVAEAQGAAMSIAGTYGFPGEGLAWREFSPTTWGLMSGQRYTYILVSRIDHPHALLDRT